MNESIVYFYKEFFTRILHSTFASYAPPFVLNIFIEY